MAFAEEGGVADSWGRVPVGGGGEGDVDVDVDADGVWRSGGDGGWWVVGARKGVGIAPVPAAIATPLSVATAASAATSALAPRKAWTTRWPRGRQSSWGLGSVGAAEARAVR
ncbi:hypothetical protein KQY30_10660 [Streptomyces sp. GMY02]|uniref:hypothetical protein n=1 Tax=Streptomyces sp. GMY02 TaxID=1333528 RepID=UPI001C2BDFCF|nr:hypothetical protein [Streptomyces sp. GMY02]QXE34674.1 hypothetical protein KQY30_10660 [Streptomyces sp. GMY02]